MHKIARGRSLYCGVFCNEDLLESCRRMGVEELIHSLPAFLLMYATTRASKAVSFALGLQSRCFMSSH